MDEQIKVEFEGKTIIYNEERGRWIWHSKYFAQLYEAKEAIEEAGIKKVPDFKPFMAFIPVGCGERHYRVVNVTSRAKVSWRNAVQYWTTDDKGKRVKIDHNDLYEFSEATQAINQKVLLLSVDMEMLRNKAEALIEKIPHASIPPEAKP